MTQRARASWVLVMALVACAAMKPRDDQTRLGQARAQLRRGAYDSAATAFAELATSRDSTIAMSARRHYVRALFERGRYDDAEVLARRYGGAELLVPLGDLLRTRGRLAQSESLYVLAAQRSKDSLTATLRLGELRFDRGDRTGAARIFGRFIDIYNSRRLTSGELLAVARAVRYLGADDPQLFKDALRAYDAAIAADSGNVDARVEL